MGKINHKFFFDIVRSQLFGGHLRVAQVAGLSAILNYWEKYISSASDDRWLAYSLGTTFWETDKTFQPIEEYGKGKGKKYAPKYYGRGFVQLTWDYNYKKMGDIFGVDLLNHPEKALELDLAVKIMFYGMQNGSFTGKKFADYFSKTKDDWVNARRIINGTDKANLIAEVAKKFYSAISYTI